MAQMAELISEDILNSIENLHRVIKDHSEKHDVKDTLAVGTIVRPVYAISVSITTCTLLKKNNKPGLCMRDPPLSPPSTLAEIFLHTCLQTHLQTSPPTSSSCRLSSEFAYGSLRDELSLFQPQF